MNSSKHENILVIVSMLYFGVLYLYVKLRKPRFSFRTPVKFSKVGLPSFVRFSIAVIIVSFVLSMLLEVNVISAFGYAAINLMLTTIASPFLFFAIDDKNNNKV